MRKDPLNNYEEHGLQKRVDKALAWLANSRDKWKVKCMNTKLQLKRLTQENKRVRDSREGWKLRNSRLKRELIGCKEKNISFQNRVKELESQIESKNCELNELKKKR